MNSAARIFFEAAVILIAMGTTVWAQPVPVDLPVGSKNLRTIGDLVYFVATDGTLYRTDGTNEGTLLLKNGGNSNPLLFTEYRGMAIWFEGGSLWRSDGTPAGTIPLTPGLNSAHVLDSTENYLFLDAIGASYGREILRTDGTTAGTILVKDVNPGSADGFKDSYAVVGNEFFFAGNDGIHGTELWKTDGTTAGTVLVKDVNPGNADGAAAPFAAADTRLFFKGTNSAQGTEVWKSDGTSGGTSIVKDVKPGSANGFSGTGEVVGNLFYFSNFDVGNPELWVTDGTEAGTQFLKSVDFQYMSEANGRVFFYNRWETGNGLQTDIWRSDGTPASTIKLISLCLDCHFAGHPFLTYGNKLYFNTQDYNGSTQYVWETDGTEAGTRTIFSEFLDGPLRFFRIVNGFLFFYTTSQGNNLALDVTDVTDAGRFGKGRVFRHSVAGGQEILMAKVGEFVFFRDHDGPAVEGSPWNPEDAFQLFQTDGLNLISLRDMFGTSFQHTTEIIDLNGKALFSTGNNPKKWWIYEPTWSKVGQIQQEVWTDVSGTKVSSIPLDAPPSSVSDLAIFETPANIADNYGSRVRGYVIAPETGDYRFWISSDDQSELSLSTDEDPANKTKIAQVTGWTDSRQWDKYTTQKSVTRNLVAGQKYYIEALLKEGTGRDHLAVGWQLPSGTLERPIPGKRLVSLEQPKSLPKIAITSPYSGRVYTPPANVTVTTAVEGLVSKVEFYNGTVKLGEDATSPFTFTWNNVSDGSYTLIAKVIATDGATNEDQLNFSVTGGTPCAGAGMIQQEFWMNVRGTRVSDIPLELEPDLIRDLADFAGPPRDMALDNYGSRIRGYICPPTTGEYTFWISGDDNVELWLSTDSNPLNKKKIAYHTGWTARNEWTKYPTQQSATITLAANQKYYIEALMKEGSGADHVSVGWRRPGSIQHTTLRGNYLIPFERQTQEPACAGTGTISFETWAGIDGTRVSSIPVNSPPDFTGERTTFEAPTNVGSNFGSRARGYICAPLTGNYTFWIASDDHAELWLSTDADPAKKRRIAYHTGWTSPRQWTRYPTQQSSVISLVAGQQYYIEALYKEDEGGDNMAVGWQLPNGTLERPIPGTRLSPFENPSSTIAARSASEEQTYFQISVYPNPVKSGVPQLTLSGYEGIEKTIETYVEIINMTGDVVFAETIRCGGGCDSYLVKLNSKLVPGLYLVTMKTNGRRHLRRLLVNQSP